jgi:hypothetical protein
LFIDSFTQTLGTLLAILVFVGLAAGLAFSALALYRRGQEYRIQLEKRAGVFELVDKVDREERAEMRAMYVRKRELGRD